jgi:hypothetical protein
MWLALIQLAALVCLGALVWYAGEALLVLKRIDISFDRLRAFLDVQDINRRKDETEEIAEVTIDRALVRAWLPGTKILLGKLLASTERIGTMGEELIAPGRSTVAMPPPQTMTGAPPPDDVAPLAAPPLVSAASPVAPALPPSDAALSPDLAEVARQMDAANNDGNRLSDDGGETQILMKPAGLILSSAPPSIPETTPKPGITPASRHRVSPTAETEGPGRMSGYHAPFFAPASIPALPSAPAQVAAGIGPRPQSTSVHATGPTSRPHAPPVKLASRGVIPEASRKSTLVGGAQAVQAAAPALELAEQEEEGRMSWAALKQAGMIGSSIRPPVVSQPRFPGTMVSMQAVTVPGSAPPSPARSVAPVVTKETCRACDGGFIHVGTGGIGRCPVCKGSGLVDTVSRV